MYGFHSDITGGLRPRYMIEQLDVSLGSATYSEKTVDAMMASSFDHDGVPVVGSIGFPLLARHFGGITFDYSRQLMYLRDPSENHVFAGRPEAWSDPADFSASLLASADLVGSAAPPDKSSAGEKPGAPKPEPTSEETKGTDEDDDPRAKYPWFVQHQALSEQLGDIRSSAPVDPQAANPQATSKQPFERSAPARLSLTERLLLFNVAESVATSITGSHHSSSPAPEAGTSEQEDQAAQEETGTDGDEDVPTDIFRRGQPRLNFSPLQDSAPDYREENAEQDSSGNEEDGDSAG